MAFGGNKSSKELLFLKDLVEERIKISLLGVKLPITEKLQRLRHNFESSEKYPLSRTGNEGQIRVDNSQTISGHSPVVCLSQKLFFCIDRYPTYNFVGRIIGPKGQILKEIEKFTGCRIQVRGKDFESSFQNEQGFNEPLNVVIFSEDIEPRARQKLQHAIQVIKPFLFPPDADKGLFDFQNLPIRDTFYLGYAPPDLMPTEPVRTLKRSKRVSTLFNSTEQRTSHPQKIQKRQK